jgi:hypothetical protein
MVNEIHNKGEEHMANDLEEKFVADDGVSTVPDAVTPGGGVAKRKLADLDKKVHPKAEKLNSGATPGQKVAESEEADDEAEVIEEVISIEESIASIFEGMDLSEDFKGKVTMVFEAAVNEAATVKANAIAEELEEEFEKQLQESIDEAMEEIVENLDSYLDYVVNEWLQENEVAIEAGIKVEMAESLMEGLKELFTEHNIEIDEDTIDVVAGLEEEIAELRGEINKAINENIELSNAVLSLEAERVFEEMTEGLTVSQRERLRSLSENLNVTDLDSYASNLETLKESFFKKAKPSLNDSTYEDEDEIIAEEGNKKPSSQYATVNALVEALDARSSKK